MSSDSTVPSPLATVEPQPRPADVVVDRIGLMLLTGKHDLNQLENLLAQLCSALECDLGGPRPGRRPAGSEAFQTLFHQQRFLLECGQALLGEVQRMRRTNATPSCWADLELQFNDFVEHYLEHEADEYWLLLQGSSWQQDEQHA